MEDADVEPCSRPRRSVAEFRSGPVRATFKPALRERSPKALNRTRFNSFLTRMKKGVHLSPEQSFRRDPSPIFTDATRGKLSTRSDGNFSLSIDKKHLSPASSDWPLTSRDLNTSTSQRLSMHGRSRRNNFSPPPNGSGFHNERFNGNGILRSRSASVSSLVDNRLRSPRHVKLAESAGNAVEMHNSVGQFDEDRMLNQDISGIDALIRQLAESELDAQSVDVQLVALKDALLHMDHQRFLTTTEWQVINTIRENCVLKLRTFEQSSRALRLVMRDQKRAFESLAHAKEHSGALSTRVRDLESHLEIAHGASSNKEEAIFALKQEITALNDRFCTVERLRIHADDARARLQRQFHIKSAECDRLNNQIRKMQSSVANASAEIEKHRKSFEEQSSKLVADKEELKKAAKAHKFKAAQLERDFEAIKDEMQRRDVQIADQKAELLQTRAKCESFEGDYRQMVGQLSACQSRCDLLDAELKKQANEMKISASQENDVQAEVSKLRSERDKLREQTTQLETRIADLQRELENTRAEHERDFRSKFAEVAANRQDATPTLMSSPYPKVTEDSRKSTNEDSRKSNNEDSRIFIKQLEQAMSEARRANDLAYDKFAVRERALQQRVGELERQLVTMRAEITRSRKDREDLEGRLSLQVRELRDQLGRAHRANGALEGYVSFLKRAAAQEAGLEEVRAALAADPVSAAPLHFRCTHESRPTR